MNYNLLYDTLGPTNEPSTPKLNEIATATAAAVAATTQQWWNLLLLLLDKLLHKVYKCIWLRLCTDLDQLSWNLMKVNA